MLNSLPDAGSHQKLSSQPKPAPDRGQAGGFNLNTGQSPAPQNTLTPDSSPPDTLPPRTLPSGTLTQDTLPTEPRGVNFADVFTANPIDAVTVDPEQTTRISAQTATHTPLMRDIPDNILNHPLYMMHDPASAGDIASLKADLTPIADVTTPRPGAAAPDLSAPDLSAPSGLSSNTPDVVSGKTDALIIAEPSPAKQGITPIAKVVTAAPVEIYPAKTSTAPIAEPALNKLTITPIADIMTGLMPGNITGETGQTAASLTSDSPKTAITPIADPNMAASADIQPATDPTRRLPETVQFAADLTDRPGLTRPNNTLTAQTLLTRPFEIQALNAAAATPDLPRETPLSSRAALAPSIDPAINTDGPSLRRSEAVSIIEAMNTLPRTAAASALPPATIDAAISAAPIPVMGASTGPVTGPAAPASMMMSAPAAAAVPLNELPQSLVAASLTARRASIQIDPPEMGRIQIDSSFEANQRTRIVLIPETEAARAAMAERLPSLIALFESHHSGRVDIEIAGPERFDKTASFDLGAQDQNSSDNNYNVADSSQNSNAGQTDGSRLSGPAGGDSASSSAALDGRNGNRLHLRI